MADTNAGEQTGPAPRATTRTRDALVGLAAVWVVGSAVAPLLLVAGVMGLFGGAMTLAVLGGGVLALATGGFALLPAAVPALARQPWRVRRRPVWAAGVTVGGTVLFLAAAWVTTQAHLPLSEHMLLWVAASGLCYMLVAALGLGRAARIAAIVLLAVLALAAPRLMASGRAAQEAAAVRQRLGADPDLVHVVEIAGYHGVAGFALWQGYAVVYGPDELPPDAVAAHHEIVLYADRQPLPPTCGPVPIAALEPAATPPAGDCERRDDGLRYRSDGERHEFLAPRDEVVLRAAGGREVSEAVLRRALLNARPATDAEIAELT